MPFVKLQLPRMVSPLSNPFPGVQWWGPKIPAPVASRAYRRAGKRQKSGDADTGRQGRYWDSALPVVR